MESLYSLTVATSLFFFSILNVPLSWLGITTESPASVTIEHSTSSESNPTRMIVEKEIIVPMLDVAGEETSFARDSQHVYHWDPVNKVVGGILMPDDASAGERYMKEVDVETFEVVGLFGIYSKDKNYVYFSTDRFFTTVRIADPKTFVASTTNAWAGEDSIHQYLHGKMVE